MAGSEWDVLVIGSANAALCAALMAREAGASLTLLEFASKAWWVGNSRRTRNLRCMHEGPPDVLIESHTEEEFWHALWKVTGGRTNERLARIAIRTLSTCRSWTRQHGVRIQQLLSGALHVAQKNVFFMGGGKALASAYYRSAHAL